MKKILLCLVIGINIFFAQTQKIAITGVWPVPSVVLYFSHNNQIIFMPQSAKNALINSLAVEFYPKIRQIKASNDQNLEELLALNADIYICHKTNFKLCEALKKAGVNLIELETNKENYNSKEVLRHWLKELENKINLNEKSSKLIDEITLVEKQIKDKTKDVKKPTAVIVFTYQDGKIRLGGLFADYLLEKSGAVNAYKSISNGDGGINIEELYRLNPDIIYISNFTQAQPQDFFKEPKFNKIKAIQNKAVYKLPLGTYRPFAPNLDLSVVLKFLASKNHPKLFGKIDIKEEFKRHFKEFYGLDLNEEQLAKILNPSSKAGNLK